MKPTQRFLVFLLSLSAFSFMSMPAWAQCVSNDDCKGARVCSAGSCVDPGCSKDTDCAGDGICVQGACRAAAAAAPAAPAPAMPISGAKAPSGDAAPVQPTGPAPYRTEKRRIKGLLIAGPIILGTVWLTTIVTTAGISVGTESSRVGTNVGYAAIPVLGPFVLLADADEDGSDFTFPLVLSGLVQAGGLAMTIVGATVKREVQVPAAVLGEGRRSAQTLTVAPSVIGQSGVGLSLSVGAASF